MVDQFGFVELVGVNFSEKRVGLAGGRDVWALMVKGEGFRQHHDVMLLEETQVEVPVLQYREVLGVEADGFQGAAPINKGVNAKLIHDGELCQRQGTELRIQRVVAQRGQAFAD